MQDISETATPSPTVNLLSLNCWGLKYISTHRHARLCEIGTVIADTSPVPDIVALQECWVQEDYRAIRERTKHILPYAKFYYSGVFGSGLVFLSRWPILETSMYQYPLNGRPTAFFRGDWFVGKGIASARIEVPHDDTYRPRSPATASHTSPHAPSNPSKSEVDARLDTAATPTTTITVLNTHLHAPYEREPHDSYLCHRTAQAWEMSKHLRSARERGHLVLAMGDFNMLPDSLAYQLVTVHGGVIDAWRAAKPDTVVNEARDAQMRATMVNGDEANRWERSVGFGLEWEGMTCDSAANTWRWDKKRRRRLDKRGTSRDAVGVSIDGEDRELLFQVDEPDPWAKRLDYIFIGQPSIDPSLGSPSRYKRRRRRSSSRLRSIEQDDSHRESHAEEEREEQWNVTTANVCMTHRHSTLHCSLTDHFGISSTLTFSSTRSWEKLPLPQTALSPSTYDHILQLTHTYTKRQTHQRHYRLAHFGVSVPVTVACLIAVWWSPHNGVAFVLMLLASLGLSAGSLDGMIGGLFGGVEMAKLREFRDEVERVRGRAAYEERAKQ